MKNITRHEGQLTMLERLNNSRNGNPRYRMAILDKAGNGFSFVTKTDCSIAYMIDGYVGQKIEAFIGNHYGKATLDNFRPIP